MAAKPLQMVNNLPTEVEASIVSTGASDAGKLVALNGSGRIDESMMPPGIGADVELIEASESLAAGDYINIHDSTGRKVRKADASTANAGKIAHGFVLDAVTSGANASVYLRGLNGKLTGLAPGTTYALSHTTPGGVVALASATTTAGQALQIVGAATATDTINTELGDPIIRG